MTITLRTYNHTEDYTRISQFLIRHYIPGNLDGNWVEPAWEYMHYHPMLNADILPKIGMWEDDGEIVGAVHGEWKFGEAFFEFHPAYRHLRTDMLQYVEEHLYATSEETKRCYLQAYVNDNDPEFITLVSSHGYQKDPQGTRPMYQFIIPSSFPAIAVPKGFRVISLADECDWAKVDRVLWRGFDHPGDPQTTEDDLADRQHMFDTPKARRDLKIVVEAPNGEFVAFCGMFYEPTGKYGYVEPVATDPSYRRQGLGKAAVLEGIRRCAALGATVAFVGSDQLFYQSIGFTKVYNTDCWVKEFA